MATSNQEIQSILPDSPRKIQQTRKAAQNLIGKPSEQLRDSLNKNSLYLEAISIKAEIKCNNHPQAPAFKAAFFMPNPFSMIIDKIVGQYKGKLNDGINEVLKSAEVKVSMSDGSPTGEFENTVDINIKVAASIIDEYSSILEFFIGDEKIVKKLTPDEIKRLHQAHEDMDQQLSKLKHQQLAINIDIMDREMQLYKEETIQPGCFSFLLGSYKKRVYQLEAPIVWLQKMSHDKSVDEHVLATSVMILKAQTKNIDNKDDRREFNKALNRILIKGGYPHTLEEIKSANAFYQDFASWSKEHTAPNLKGYEPPVVKDDVIAATL